MRVQRVPRLGGCGSREEARWEALPSFPLVARITQASRCVPKPERSPEHVRSRIRAGLIRQHQTASEVQITIGQESLVVRSKPVRNR